MGLKIIEPSFDGYEDVISNVEYGKYPGGEIYLKTDINCCHPRCIQMDYRSSDDILALMLLTDALSRSGNYISQIGLSIPYFPYARQDRADSFKGAANQSLSVKVMSNIINSLGYRYVQILEPHSDVAPALIENVAVINFEHYFYPYAGREYVLICPDQGAIKRTERFAKRHNISEIIMCEKVRDMATGQITNTAVHNVEKLEGKNKVGLIVDDICDGGRTFIEIAKKIRETNSKTPLHLFVAHGIFSQGKDVLYDYFEKVQAVNDFTINN